MKKKKLLLIVAAILVMALAVFFFLRGRDGESRTLMSLTGEGSQVSLHFSAGEEAPAYHAAELLGDQRLGYIGAAREDLSFLGASVIKVWMDDVTAAEGLIDSLGACKDETIASGTVPVYTLQNGVKAIVTEPAAEDALVVYLGLDRVWEKVEMAWDGDNDCLMFRFLNEN